MQDVQGSALWATMTGSSDTIQKSSEMKWEGWVLCSLGSLRPCGGSDVNNTSPGVHLRYSGALVSQCQGSISDLGHELHIFWGGGGLGFFLNFERVSHYAASWNSLCRLAWP